MVAPLVLVVMGVSGSGKTTVGSLLAGRPGWPYLLVACASPKAHRVCSTEHLVA